MYDLLFNGFMIQCSFDKVEILLAPFDYAQGDCQTERSRSLLLATKRT